MLIFVIRSRCLDVVKQLHNYASMHVVISDPVQTLQALADITRLRIIKLFVSMPHEEACLCELTDTLREPEYNVSRHLKILRHVGLLSASKEGRWVYHRLVRSDDSLAFYKLVATLREPQKQFESDLRRFREEIRGRTESRCVKASSKFERALLKAVR